MNLDRPYRLLSLVLCAGAFGPLVTSAQDTSWPQWRGPDRTGISTETRWNSEGKPEPLWTKQLGLGHSSFSISDGKVYTLGYDAEAKLDSVFCLEVETGKEVWRHTYPSEIWDVAHDGGTLTTPTIVGDLVYTSNREGKVFCFDKATGEVKWSRDLREDMELEPPTWGFSASPLVVDNDVILNIDRVVMLDRRDGEELWVTEKPYGKAYSTPAPFQHGGREMLAVLSGSGLVVLDREEGLEMAFYPWSKDPEIYPMTPVVMGDRIFISAGYERGAAMLRFDGESLEEIWSSRVMRNKMSGCVLWKDHLFGFDESILKCIDLEGNERWRKRGMGTGSMTVAGDRLIILTGRGQIIVAEANPEEYVELSRQSVLDGGTAWSTPVLCDGLIYCRSSLGQMAVLDHRGAGPATAEGGTNTDDLPEADEIVARHVTAMDGRAAAAKVKRLRMRGKSSSLINTVRTGDIELAWDADRGFTWNDDAGTVFGHDKRIGWIVLPRIGASLLRGDDLAAIQQAGDFTRLFDPTTGYHDFKTIDSTVFEGVPCFVVKALTREGLPRTLFFSKETGLLTGHQEEGTYLWTFADYREVDGVMLPAEWGLYEPINGERSTATFDSIEVNPEADPELFEVPRAVKPLMRSDKEIAADNERLSKLHAKILGSWRPEEEKDAEMKFEVRDGFLMFLNGSREPSPLAEPDENGVISMLNVDYVKFTPIKDDSGAVTSIEVHVGGEFEERLVR